jgi:hypothetical protein
VVINNNYIVSNYRGNNVYRSRRDVVTYDRSRYDNRGNRNSGYSQNGNRAAASRNYGNTNRRHNGAQDMSNNNNRDIQRPGRFGRIQQRNNDGNVDVNRPSNQQTNGLPNQRSGRIYNPQGNGSANPGNVSDNANNANNDRRNVPDVRGRFGNRRTQTTEADATNPTTTNPGNRYGRTTQPATGDGSSNDNARPNRLPGRFSGQPQGNSQQQTADNNANSGQPRRGNINNGQGNQQTERPDRISRPQRNVEVPATTAPAEQPQRVNVPQRQMETPRQNTTPDQPQRVRLPERRSEERNQAADQPQRVYNPQRNIERQESNSAPVQRQESRRPAPAPSSQEINRANDGGGNRGSQGSDAQRSVESRVRRAANQ